MNLVVTPARMRAIRDQLGWTQGQLADWLFLLPDRLERVQAMEEGRRPIIGIEALLVASLAPDAPDYLRAA